MKKFAMTWAGVVLALATVSGDASAAQVWVNPDPVYEAEYPYNWKIFGLKTVEEALAFASAGDTITLSGGYEYPPFGIAKDGISVVGELGYDVVVRGDGSGAVIFIESCSDVVLNALEITGGGGRAGGGILIKDSKRITVVGCHVLGNSATEGGGGIGVYNSENVWVSHNTIERNQAPKGGGIGALDAEELMLHDNHVGPINDATERGAGIWMGSGTTAFMTADEVYRNESLKDGGGLFVGEGATLACTSVVFHRNVAIEGNGGGACLWGSGEVTFTDCQFTKNRALWPGGLSSSGFGGGLLVRGTAAAVAVKGGSFTDNLAGQDGGGVRVDGAKTVVSIGGDGGDVVFAVNRAGDDGGGLSVTGGAKCEVTKCAFSGCEALGQNGGAMHCTTPGSFVTIMGGQANTNTAAWGGGGVFVRNARAIIAGMLLQENKATGQNGGGILLLGTSNASLEISGATQILKNSALNSGAGVCVKGLDGGAPRFDVADTSFEGNDTSASGQVRSDFSALIAGKSSGTLRNCKFLAPALVPAPHAMWIDGGNRRLLTVRAEYVQVETGYATGIAVFGANLHARDTTITGATMSGVTCSGSGRMALEHCLLRDNGNVQVEAIGGATATVTASVLDGAGGARGLVVAGQQSRGYARGCSIVDHSEYGAARLFPTAPPPVVATGNWWGDATGPRSARNPGSAGDAVTDWVMAARPLAGVPAGVGPR